MTQHEGTTATDLIDLIEAARRSRNLSNDMATALTSLLKLEGDEAMLACRLLGAGADPASLQYMFQGSVSEKIALAHRQGPAVFERDDPERSDYLLLCNLSADENAPATLCDNLLGFVHAVRFLQQHEVASQVGHSSGVEHLIEIEEQKIMAQPYMTVDSVLGVRMRVYYGEHADRGQAAAVWDEENPQTLAANLGIQNGEPYVAIGAPPYHPTLAEQGVDTSKLKLLSDRFGILDSKTHPALVRTIFAACDSQ